MNITHLHLLTNHLPILGGLFGMLILGYGLLRKNRSLITAGLVTFVLTGISALFPYFTGETAEEAVEGLAGVSHNMLEQHEEAASIALGLTLFLGALSLIYLLLEKRLKNWKPTWSFVPLIVSIFVFASMARVGYLGGQIRHSEIRQASVTNTGDSGGDIQNMGEDEDDD